MFRIPLITLALASISASPAGFDFGPASSVASVKGSGTVTFGSSVEHITVNATGNTGRATFQDRAAGGNFNGQIEINCVNVVGKTATVSGLVTHANDKTLIGKEGVFQIVDNGKRSDLATIINFHDPGTSTDCRAGEFDLSPVKGDFTVQS